MWLLEFDDPSRLLLLVCRCLTSKNNEVIQVGDNFNVFNATIEVKNYAHYRVYETNFTGMAQILVQPQYFFVTKNDIVVVPTM